MTPCKGRGLLAWSLVVAAVVGLTIPAAGPAVKTDAPAIDHYGDALPEGATARLGTLRLRQGNPVVALAFAPDGRTLVSTGPYHLRLWHLPDGESLDRAKLGVDGFQAVAFSHDGKHLAVVHDHQFKIRVYDLRPAGADGKSLALGPKRFDTPDSVRPLAFVTFLPDDSEILSVDVNGRAQVWDAVKGKRVRSFGDDRGGVGAVAALAPDGQTLAIAMERRGGRGGPGGGPGGRGGPGGGRGGPGMREDAIHDLVVWDVAEGVQLDARPNVSQVGEGSAIAFSPDGTTLAIGDTPDTVRLWDVTGRNEVVKLGVAAPAERGRAPKNSFGRSLFFTPDGQAIVSLGRGVVRVWDVATKKERPPLQGWNRDFQVAALSADGKRLAAAGDSGVIQVWDLATGTQRDELSQVALSALAVAPDGKHVALAAVDGVVRLYQRDTGKLVRTLRGHEGEPSALAFAPDGKTLISTSVGDGTRTWDLATGKQTALLPAVAKEAAVVNARLTPDGKTLARPLLGKTEIVDVATGQVLRSVPSCDALSSDGRLAAGVSADRDVCIWETATDKLHVRCRNSDDGVVTLTFSPDQRLLAGLTVTSRVQWWDADTGRRLGEVLLTDEDYPLSAALAFSPDGRLLAINNPRGVALCEPASGQIVWRLESRGSMGVVVAFAPDGRSLVSAGSDTTALVWDLTGATLRTRRATATAADLDARWVELLGDRADDAQVALLALANAPRPAVSLLRTRLLGNPADAEAVSHWLTDLNDDRYEVREQASAALARYGRTIEPELRETTQTTKSAEVRRRAKALLSRLGGDRVSERLGAQRLTAVLELAATPEARTLLEELAKKGPSEQLRRHAQAALDRISRPVNQETP